MAEEDVLDKLRRAYARVSGLRSNLPEHRADERYVTEYHEALQHLADLGLNIDEFKIPDKALTQRVQSTNPSRGIKHMTNDRFVDTPFFRGKLDAVQSYIDMLLKAPARDIGFPRA